MKKIILNGSAILLVFLFGCQKPMPVASFTMSKTSAKVNEVITFSNNSTEAISYVWDFGDGKSSTSNNPSHSYLTAGTFNIELTATGEGGTHAVSNSIVISYNEPIAKFTIDPSPGNIKEEISFGNNSEYADSFTWDFGDSNSSTERNPTHIYTEEGIFTIVLTATGNGGTDTASENIEILLPMNIIPGESAMDIALEERWLTVKNKLGSNYQQRGPILLSSGSSSFVIHPIESESQGILLYLLSVTGSFNLSTDDIVFLISLSENFIGKTDKGIMMGSSLSEVEEAYGDPDVNDTKYSAYRYDIGIDFYFDNSSHVDGISISSPSSMKSSLLLNLLIEKLGDQI